MHNETIYVHKLCTKLQKKNKQNGMHKLYVKKNQQKEMHMLHLTKQYKRNSKVVRNHQKNMPWTRITLANTVDMYKLCAG